jgi:hypothetical protein
LSFDNRTLVLGAAAAPPALNKKAHTTIAAPISFRITSPSSTMKLVDEDGSPVPGNRQGARIRQRLLLPRGSG